MLNLHGGGGHLAYLIGTRTKNCTELSKTICVQFGFNHINWYLLLVAGTMIQHQISCISYWVTKNI